MRRVIATAAAVLLLACLPANPALAQAGEAMMPGHEAAALALLGPEPAAHPLLPGWTVESVGTGPDCAVRLGIVRDGEPGRVDVVLRPRGDDDGPGPPSFAVRFSGSDVDDEALDAVRQATLARITANDPGGFFEGRCRGVARTAGRGPDGGESAMAAPAGGPWLHLLLLLVAAGAFVWLGRLTRAARQADPTAREGADPEGDLARSRRRALWALVAFGVALRGWLMFQYPPIPEELWSLNRATLLDGGSFIRVELGAYAYHPPLHELVSQIWATLGDPFGVGGEIAWVRALNLPIFAVLAIFLVRLGRLLGSWSAGFVAAVVACAHPTLVALSVVQTNNFAEMVACVVFVERLAACGIARRPVQRSLALCAVLPLALGHLAHVVVGPGLLLFAVLGLRRRERAATLAALVLFLALYAPLLQQFAAALYSYLGANLGTTSGGMSEAEVSSAFGHGSLEAALGVGAGRPGGILTELAGAVAYPSGVVAACLALLAGALTLLRPVVGAYVLVVVGSYVLAGTLIYMRLPNYSSALPFLLLSGPLAVSQIARRFGPPPLRPVALTLLAAAYLAGGQLGHETMYRRSRTGMLERWTLAPQRPVSAPLRVMEALDPDGKMPRLLLGNAAETTLYALCPTRDTRLGLRACLHAVEEVDDDPRLPLCRIGERTYALPFEKLLSAEMAPRCAELDTVLGLPPWSDGPFWMIANHFLNISAEHAAVCGARFRALRRRCALVTWSEEHALYRCPAGTPSHPAPEDEVPAQDEWPAPG